MNHIFISWDSQDENMIRPIVHSLRRNNPDIDIFWSADSIEGGAIWDTVIYNKLHESEAIIGILTNGKSGLNNFINFEIGAAIGGNKKRLIITAPGLTASLELSEPLKRLQYTSWNARQHLKSNLSAIGLSNVDITVDEIITALTPYTILKVRYGVNDNWYEFPEIQRQAFADLVENKKTDITVTNALINNLDPCYGSRKTLEVTVERVNRTQTLSFQEGYRLKRSDLWISG